MVNPERVLNNYFIPCIKNAVGNTIKAACVGRIRGILDWKYCQIYNAFEVLLLPVFSMTGCKMLYTLCNASRYYITRIHWDRCNEYQDIARKDIVSQL